MEKRPKLPSERLLITALFGLLAFGIFLFLSFVIGARAQDQIAQDRGSALQDLAASTAAALSDHLYERQREVGLLADAEPIKHVLDAPQEAQALIDRVHSRLPHYVWMGIADAHGTVRVGTEGILIGHDASARPWFAPALKGPFIGDLHKAQMLAKFLPPQPDGEPPRFLDFATPIRDSNGTVIGVLSAHGGWRWAQEIALRLFSADHRPDGVELFIYNRAGDLLLSNREGATPVPPRSAPNGHALLEWSDGRFMTAAALLPTHAGATDLGWRIVVRQPETVALRLAHHARDTTLIAGLVAIAAFMGLAWLLAGVVIKPMQAIVASARRIEGGDTTSEIPTSQVTRELYRLGEALRGMTSTLLRQKQALAEANEELEARVAARTHELQDAVEELDALARSDALTGLANRRAADERLDYELKRSRRSGAALSLMLVDIDHFKRINDRFGHEQGDVALQAVANTMATSLRGMDLVARFGGEEFLVLLPDTDTSQALCVAEKLRAAIAALELPLIGRITASFGVASLTEPETSASELIRRADIALYAAKGAGRNRVMTVEESTVPDGI
jgi:diguanylate cyclase